jgi:hypothetical protein
MNVSGERIKFVLEMLEDGRVRARTHDDAISVEGRDVSELRQKIDVHLRALTGESRRIQLLVRI